VAEWKGGEFIRLEAVPQYWQGRPAAIKTLTFRFIANTNTRINQLKSGEVDMVVMFPWDKHREVAAIPGVSVHRIDGNGYEHVTLNERAFPAFADVRVRQALTHAVDRELISTTILEGLAPVTHGPVQPVSWAHNPNVRTYAFDPVRARALLDEAGWRDTNGDGVRDKDGRRFPFPPLPPAGAGTHRGTPRVRLPAQAPAAPGRRCRVADGPSLPLPPYVTGGYSEVADAQLAALEHGPDPDLYNAVLDACELDDLGEHVLVEAQGDHGRDLVTDEGDRFGDVVEDVELAERARRGEGVEAGFDVVEVLFDTRA